MSITLKKENDYFLSRVVKNLASLVGSEILSRTCGLVLVIVLARYLGPEKYGLYSLAFIFYGIFLLLSNLGIDTVITKNVSRDLTQTVPYISFVSFFKIISSFLSFSIIAFLVLLLGYGETTRMGILLLCVAIFFSTQYDLISAIFFAYEKMEFPSIINSIRSLLSLGFIIALIRLGKDVHAILSAQLFAIIICTLIQCYIFGKLIVPLKNVRLQFKIPTEIIRESLHFFLVAALFILNTRMDILMISWFMEERSVGVYASAIEIINILMILPALISKVLFPVFSKNYKENKPAMVIIANTAIRFNIILGVPLSIGMLLLSSQLVNFIFGVKYLDAGIILMIFSVNLFLFFPLTILSWIYSATDNVSIIVKSSLISIIINITLNMMLIPIYGLPGAALATVTCSVFRTLFLYNFKLRKYPDIVFFKAFDKPIIASVVMGGAVYFLRSLRFLLVVFMGICIYFLILFLVRGFTHDDWLLLKSLFRNKSQKA
ncbi:flippase [Thermodesulfobacteriota bacterium]